MNRFYFLLLGLWGMLMFPQAVSACSVLYYIDTTSGKIFLVNSEDYFLDVNAYIQIEPRTKSKFARLWYGWDKFAQGGINEKGLFFDGAVTPRQEKIKGFGGPSGNLGDELLAYCATVEEALAYLEKKRIALDDSHMMIGDRGGNAVVVEWVKGKRELHWIQGNKLLMTNYLLSDTAAGNYPCFRYNSIESRIEELENSGEAIDLLKIGNTFGQAVQPPRAMEDGRLGGTVYTSFMDLTANKFYLSYKLSNTNMVKLDLNKEFGSSKRKKIKLKD